MLINVIFIFHYFLYFIIYFIHIFIIEITLNNLKYIVEKILT